MKPFFANMIKHPVSVLYGTLLLILALCGSISGVLSGSWDAAMVDLVMAVILLGNMFQNISRCPMQAAGCREKWTAWVLLVGANLLMLMPESNLAGGMIRAFSFVILLMSVILHFTNWRTALYCLPATLWCCIFIPYHEELMLMASYPLRLSATMLAAFLLKMLGTGVVYSGTSLHLPDLDIAITDACSGIGQLDAFLLIAYIAVKLLHSNAGLQVLHFTFVVPSIILGNSLRIVLTVLLYKMFGDVILGNFWHVSLGYMQILAALLIFIAIGKLFRSPALKQEEK